MNDKTNYILKRDWLNCAKSYKKSAAAWRKCDSGWSKEFCDREAESFLLKHKNAIERSWTAPIKIVLHFEDGTTQEIV